MFIFTLILSILMFALPGPARAAHFAHSPAVIVGPYTVEASKIYAIHIYPTLKHMDVEVQQGSYTTTVNAAIAAVGNVGDDTAVSGGTYSDKNRTRTYTVTVTTGGALGVAKVSWTTDKLDDEGGPVIVVVGGTAIGTKGIQLNLAFGADLVLTLGNKWTVKGQRDFQEITALHRVVILTGADFMGIAVAAPDVSQKTIFGTNAKKAYQSLGSYLGWVGSVMALDEF